MKNLIFTIFTTLFLLVSCDGGKIGKYQKEPLPDNFSYNIIEDKSSDALEKNQLTLEIKQKLTEGQIATLAEELLKSKNNQRRFYIFYILSGMKNGSSTWATSHFDPELDIQIIGSTSKEDENSNKISSEQIDGEVIGKWIEEQYTSSNYIIYIKENRTFLKSTFKNGQTSEEELTDLKVQNGVKYFYKEGGFNGEYFILNLSGDLEFYNSENKNFTSASKTK
ncbi:hypothetical protein [Flavobacterium sp.]|uniref:hypothetical protein n=1 Tax=Flavobacterium sp. TaxID=239 RepID=UPI0033404BA4